MLKWLLAGLCTIVPLWSGEHEAPVPIALYFDFQQMPTAAVREALQREVEVVMAPLGAEFEWRSLKTVSGGEVSTQLAVVRFLGHCEAGLLTAPRRSKETALGWTHVSDGVILPFSDIDCDGIRQFIEIGLMGYGTAERDTVYGRALGRVLAHELYHIFANTVHHGSNGVGKAVYSVRDLLSPDFHFEEHESDLLRANRPRGLAEGEEGTH